MKILKKTVLVAGGAGFVGSHLCDALVKAGRSVICLDNLSTGSRVNISHLLGNTNFRFVKSDVVKPVNFKVDEIYHLASPASPIHYQKDAVATFKANVLGSLNLLSVAKKNKAKILLASTSEIYGDPLVHPQKESYWGNVNSVGPRSCYDESKRASETIFNDYGRQYGVRTKIVRIFNTYGPKMAADDGRVVSNFIMQALFNKSITIFGNGNQTRSFQYVDDLITGLLKMMSASNFSGPVNIGNPGEFNIKQLAGLVIKLTGSKSKVVFKPLPQDDPRKRKPDISLAKAALGWRPKVSLREGLKKTIEYYKNISYPGINNKTL